MQLILVILVIAVLVLAGLLWKLTSKNDKSESFVFLQNQLNELHRMVDTKIGESQKEMRESVHGQMKQSHSLIKDVTDQLVKVQKNLSESAESSKQVLGIAESLHNLEKVLKNQKQRGNLGEAGLKLILENILPPGAFELQYSFDDGTICDAVIFTKNGMVPIDAKFSLDNYNRAVNEEDEARREQYEKEFVNDLKKRIDETAKYVREKDGTLPFALMYIPAEGIYYDLLIGKVGSATASVRNLIEYAHKDKKVVIVSPTTIVAYLHTILQGFKAFQIEERAKDIEKNVEKLGRHLKAYEDYHSRLGNSLSTTVNHFNKTSKELGKIDKDVLRITGEGIDLELEQIEKPTKEE